MFALFCLTIKVKASEKTATLRTLAEELVALERGRKSGFSRAPHHLADAAQTHVDARSWDLWKRDQILDRLTDLYRSLRCKQDARRAYIFSLALGFGAARPPDNLK